MAFERLQYLVTLDPTNATAGAGKIAAAVKKSVAEADAEIAKLQRRIDQLNNKSLKLGKQGDSAGSEGAFREAQGLQGQLGGLKAASADAGGIGGLSAVATQAAVAGAALAGVGASLLFVKKSVGDFQSLTAEVRAFARTSGASAKDASDLTFAVKRFGIEPEVAAKGMFILGKNVENSQGKLKGLGVEIAHTANGNVDLVETLKNVATAYQGTDDFAKKNAISQAAFGKGGQALLPILGKNREELEATFALAKKQGLEFDPKTLEQGRQLSVALKDIGSGIQGIEVDTAKGFLPLIQDLAGAANAAVPLVHSLRLIDLAIGGIVGSTPIVGPILAAFATSKRVKDEDTAATAANTDGVRLNADASKVLTSALGSQTDAATLAANAEKDLTAAAQGRLTAAAGLLSAEDKVTAAKKAVTDAAKGEAEKTAQLADAQRVQADAAANLADKEAALRQAQKEAPRDLERAGIAARKAADAQKAAQAELDKQHRRRPGSDKEAAAKDDLASATLDALDAQDRLNELQAKGGVPKSVTDATKARDDALRARDAAERHTNDVLAINPYTAQVKAAQDLRDAEADRLVAVSRVQQEYGGVNAALLNGLNLATATREQLDALVNKLKEAQALGPTINPDLHGLPGNVLPQTTPGLQAQLHPDFGGLPQPSGPVAASAAALSRTTIHAQYVNPTINVAADDPNKFADAMAAKNRLSNLVGGSG